MPGVLAHFLARNPGARVLLVVATAREARAVLRGLNAPESLAERTWVACSVGAGFDLVVTGISKANAAGAVGHVLDPAIHGAMVSVGVGGLLPGWPWEPGKLFASTRSVFADEGVQTPSMFLDCPAMGFPFGPSDGPAVMPDADLFAALRPITDAAEPVATVSTCSGTDALAHQVRDRTGAAVEAMEGAAAGLVAARLGVPFAEVRAVSNTTGDRPGQRWDLEAALDAIARFMGRL